MQAQLLWPHVAPKTSGAGNNPQIHRSMLSVGVTLAGDQWEGAVRLGVPRLTLVAASEKGKSPEPAPCLLASPGLTAQRLVSKQKLGEGPKVLPRGHRKPTAL